MPSDKALAIVTLVTYRSAPPGVQIAQSQGRERTYHTWRET